MKKSSLIYKIRRKLQVFLYSITSKEFVSKLYFRMVLHYPLHLDNPKTFNEKLQWLKLYYCPFNNNVIICSDKYMVREYVNDFQMGFLLNDLIGVYDDAYSIDFDNIPMQFVLKCNHGCGYNIICKNKNEFNIKKSIKLLNKWMKEDFSKFNAEPHYSKIKRKIVCEKYLGDLTNYNIYVFNGKVVFFSVAGGLGDGNGEFLNYYLSDLSPASFTNKHFKNKNIELSKNVLKMFEFAKKLSGDFPMVRVDFYDVDNKIILSEMTFTPGGALIPFSSKEDDLALGELLDISRIMETKK